MDSQPELAAAAYARALGLNPELAVAAYERGPEAIEKAGRKPFGTTYERVFAKQAQPQQGILPGGGLPSGAGQLTGTAGKQPMISPEMAQRMLWKKHFNMDPMEDKELIQRTTSDGGLITSDKYGNNMTYIPGPDKYDLIKIERTDGSEDTYYVQKPRTYAPGSIGDFRKPGGAPGGVPSLQLGQQGQGMTPQQLDQEVPGAVMKVQTKPPTKETPTPIPPDIDKYIANDVEPIMGELEQLKMIVQQHPDVLGTMSRMHYGSSRMPVLSGVMEAFGKNPPSYVVDFHQILDRVMRTELKAYAGSAMSVQEMKRTVAALPSAYSSPEQFMRSVDAVGGSVERYKKTVYDYYSKTPKQRAEENKGGGAGTATSAPNGYRGPGKYKLTINGQVGEHLINSEVDFRRITGGQ